MYEHYLKALQVSKLNNTPLISLTNTSSQGCYLLGLKKWPNLATNIYNRQNPPSLIIVFFIKKSSQIKNFSSNTCNSIFNLNKVKNIALYCQS